MNATSLVNCSILRHGRGEVENHFVSEYQYDSLSFELEHMHPGGISQSFAYTSGV